MAQNRPPEAMMAALAAVHKAGTSAQDPSQGTGGGGAAANSQATAGPPDPSQQGQDPNAQDPSQDPNAEQGQDPQEQAVWDEFPSTDPNAVGSLAQQMQGGDPQDLVSLLGQWMQQAQADQDKLSQMQESLLSHLMDLLGGPAPDGGQAASMPTGASQVPGGPGVTGGNGTGY
jgi:hypothetical protein